MISYLVKIFQFNFFLIHAIFNMALREGYYNPICNQIPETVKFILNLFIRRKTIIFNIIIINILNNITIEDMSKNEVFEILKKLDINTTSPIEALQKLYELKKYTE